MDVLPGVTLARIGGHFDGAAVLHWAAGSEGRGALLTGDTITVVQDREWVSFMWSYPNLIPLDAATMRTIVERVDPFPFDRIYGGWWGGVVVTDGPGAVRRSAERYIARVTGVSPPRRRRGGRRACAGPPRPSGRLAMRPRSSRRPSSQTRRSASA